MILSVDFVISSSRSFSNNLTPDQESGKNRQLQPVKQRDLRYYTLIFSAQFLSRPYWQCDHQHNQLDQTIWWIFTGTELEFGSKVKFIIKVERMEQM